MLKSKSFLAVDFGAGSLKLAEFEPNEAGGLRLKQYGIKPLGLRAPRSHVAKRPCSKALQELLAEKSFGTRQINICAPGFPRLFQVRQTAAGGHFQGDADHPLRSPAERAFPAGRSGLGLSDPWHIGHQRTGSASRGRQVGDRRRPLSRGRRSWIAAEAGGRLSSRFVQRFSLQLRRLGGLHDAAGYRRQDQQPALLRKGQGLFPEHQHRSQFHHPGFCQRVKDAALPMRRR